MPNLSLVEYLYQEALLEGASRKRPRNSKLQIHANDQQLTLGSELRGGGDAHADSVPGDRGPDGTTAAPGAV